MRVVDGGGVCVPGRTSFEWPSRVSWTFSQGRRAMKSADFCGGGWGGVATQRMWSSYTHGACSYCTGLIWRIYSTWMAYAFEQWRRSDQEERYCERMQAARWYQALASRSEKMCIDLEEELAEDAAAMSAELLAQAATPELVEADRAHREVQEAELEAELWRLKAEELEAKAAVSLAHRRGVLGTKSSVASAQ